MADDVDVGIKQERNIFIEQHFIFFLNKNQRRRVPAEKRKEKDFYLKHLLRYRRVLFNCLLLPQTQIRVGFLGFFSIFHFVRDRRWDTCQQLFTRHLSIYSC